MLTPRPNLAAAADRGPADFAELLLVSGVGARTVRALAMVAEVMHGAPYRFTDPAHFSFAHGGKDRHPFPVPLRVYDQTIQVLKSAVQKAKLGREEELGALKRLDDQARLVERHTSSHPVEALIAEERRLSHSYQAGAFSDGSVLPGIAPPSIARVATQAPARSRLRDSNSHESDPTGSLQLLFAFCDRSRSLRPRLLRVRRPSARKMLATVEAQAWRLSCGWPQVGARTAGRGQAGFVGWH